MSLESKVESLTAAILALTAQIATLQNIAPAAKPVVEDTKAVEEVIEVVEEKPAPKAKKKAVKKEEPVETETPTVEELQALCMTIVRADRTLGPEVKAAIAGFGDAKTIKQVPESDLVELQGLLNAIKEKA